MTFSHYNHNRFEVKNCNILKNEGDILEFESQIRHQVETGYDEPIYIFDKISHQLLFIVHVTWKNNDL